ncbi:hypothetical protein ACHAWF_004567 [Thalassiosira exigua]
MAMLSPPLPLALALAPFTAVAASLLIPAGVLAFQNAARRSLATQPIRSAALSSPSSFGRAASTPTSRDMSATSGEGGADVKRIGIIGGGAAGLATARAFLRSNRSDRDVRFEVTVLESRDCVGGIWKYDDDEESKRTRPMYRNLRTNLPKELMAYREFPWGGDGAEASYVTHKQVQKYLEDYAREFDLLEHVRFGCRVDHLKVLEDDVRGEEDSGCGSWPRISLDWTDKKSNQHHEQTFDSVCVCNGHYALPSSPHIHGISKFSGKIIHAIEYDDPKVFEGQTVLCVGARASGADIAREIGSVANRVYLSDSTCDTMQEFGNMVLMPRTQSIDNNGEVCFSASDGKDWKANGVDVIIFCSGYDYSFPFINDESNLDLVFSPGERRVQPLYEQLWHARYPSLSFIGLPHSVLPFPLFEMQSSAVISQLLNQAGSIPLPSLSERLESAKSDAESGGPDYPGRVQDTHFLGPHQWDYCRKISKIAGTYDTSMKNYIATNEAIYNKSGQEKKAMTRGEDLYRETRFRRKDKKQTYEILHSELESTETAVGR